MADYERMNLENGDTVYAEHVDHIEDALVQNEQNITTNEKNLDYLESDIEELQNCCTTVNETLDDLKEQTAQNTEDIEEVRQSTNSMIAVGVYSDKDNSLTLFAVNTKSDIPKEGSTYNGKTVTEVYTDFESLDTWRNLPWLEHTYEITSVTIEKSFSAIKPTYIECWFYDFTVCTEIKGLNYLDTSLITSMYYLFGDCYKITELDVSEFDTSSVTEMEGMFYYCKELKTIYSDDENFVTTNVTSGKYMFTNCTNLVGGNGYKFSSNSTGEYMAHVDAYGEITGGEGYFTQAKNLNYAISEIDKLGEQVAQNTADIEDLKSGSGSGSGGSGDTTELEKQVTQNTENIADLQTQVTQNTADIETLKNRSSGAIIAFAIYSEDDHSLSFYAGTYTPETGDSYDGKTVTEVYTGFDTEDYTSLSAIPWYSQRTNINIINFDKSFSIIKPVSTAYWFYNDVSCTKINNIDYLNTSNVTNMQYMFYACYGLTSLDLSSFDTRNVTNMQDMFYYDDLTSLNLNNFNTSNVTNMNAMFCNCANLTSLDLSSFDTNKVTNMQHMFYNDSGLITIYSSNNFVTTAVTSGNFMFTDCNNLVGGNGTLYDSSKIDYTMAHIDTAENAGYFTQKKDLDYALEMIEKLQEEIADLQSK